jgi:transmembrane sensor
MDHSGADEFNELLNGYLQESLNPQELTRFFEMAAAPEYADMLAKTFRKDLKTVLPDLTNREQIEGAWLKVRAEKEKHPRSVIQMRMVFRWVAIVICLLGGTIAVYRLRQSNNHSVIASTESGVKTPAWLKAEHIGAVLILANGDSVALDNQDKGVIATQDGIQAIQSEGVIRYAGVGQNLLYNEIRTGKGKLWRAILPDQTVVWLNGNSSIKYPLRFTTDTRSVEMTGEVYFAVIHNSEKPFLVHIPSTPALRGAGANRQPLTIQDLGTSFNIRSYVDDSITTATLVEGSVRVSRNSQQVTLIPGQKSVAANGNNEIRIVQHADMNEALAWKNGIFYFQNAGLPEVMKQLADWYQVGVVYKGRPGGKLFSGQIDKSLSLSYVLEGLQQPGVKFSLDGNRITVIQE